MILDLYKKLFGLRYPVIKEVKAPLKVIEKMEDFLLTLDRSDSQYFTKLRLKMLTESAKTKETKELEKDWLEFKKEHSVKSRAKDWGDRYQIILKVIADLNEMDRVNYGHVEIPSSKVKRTIANDRAVSLINEKGLYVDNYSEEEKEELVQFTGYGGLGKDKNEYYTPRELANASWSLLGKTNAGDVVLDPSCGTGIFSNTAPIGVSMDASEANTASASIASILNPNTDVSIGTFEALASQKNAPIYDGIITNVPFGKREELYTKDDDKYSDVTLNEDYFMFRSMDLLKPEKRAVFLTSSRTIQGGNRREQRLEMLRKGAFIGGYRLPSKMFKETGTDVVVDILVFEKHPDKYLNMILKKQYQAGNFLSAIEISDPCNDFLNGEYFENRPKQVLGNFESKEQKEQMALELGHTKEALDRYKMRDTVSNDDNIEDIKKSLKKKILNKFSNKFGYGELYQIRSEEEIEAENKIIEDVRQRLLQEISDIEDGEGLHSTDFEKLYDEAKEVGLLDSGFASNITPFFLLKHISIKNKIGDDYRVLFEFFFHLGTGADKTALAYVGNNNEYFKALLVTKKITKLRKHFNEHNGNRMFKYALSFMSIRSDEELKTLKEANSLSSKKQVATLADGSSAYSIDSFTEEELKDNNIGIIEIDGKPYATDMHNVVKKYDLMTVPDAMLEIGKLETPKGVNDDLYQDKISATMDIVSSFQHTPSIDNLAFSLDMMKEYFTEETNREIMQELRVLAQADIDRIYKDKVLDTIATNIKQLHEIGVKTADIKPDWTLFSVISASRLFDESLRINRYIQETDDDKISFVKGIYQTSFNDVKPLLSYYLRSVIMDSPHIRTELENALSNKSIIKFKRPKNWADEQSSPLEELRGTATDEVIQMARLYQNEGARKFGIELKGTCGDDTGLGKTITMLLSSLMALSDGRAKRVIVTTPNSVVAKLEAEFRKFITPEWQEKVTVLNSKTFIEDVSTIISSKKIRLIIAPHSTMNFFKLKSATLKELTELPVVTGVKEQHTPFYDLIKNYPPFDEGKMFFENMGVDAIFIDEQQNFKNGASPIGLRRATHTVSKEHIGLQYLCEYIRHKRGDGRGTVCVTATPLSNNPSEIVANMLLSGAYKDDNGNPLSGFSSADDFKSTYIKQDPVMFPKVNGEGVTISDTFVGFKSFQRLKNIMGNSIIFRDAESEQARVKGLKVKPNYETVGSVIKETHEIAQTFKNLAKINEKWTTPLKDKADRAPIELVRDDFDSMMSRGIGETFGFINRVRNLSNGKNFANNITPILIKQNTVIEEIEDVLGKTAYFTFGLYKDKATLSLSKLKVLPIREETQDYVAIRKVKGVDTVDQEITQGVNDLAPDLIVVRDGKTFFNAYTTDDKKIDSIIKKLQKAEIVTENEAFHLPDYPKYISLLDNIKKEYERKAHSKQIIFSDKPILTQRIIGQMVSFAVKNGELPMINVQYFNESMGGLKSDKSNAMELQDRFNTSITPDIMIYGISGITGVDFNKNVSSVHLMNIPDTPDIHHQAMGRAVRQGNDMDKVKVYKYFTEGTLDLFLDKLVSGKQGWINSLKDGKESEDEVTLSTSSREQIISNATNMFAGQNMSHPEMITAYLAYQKEQVILQDKEIQAIKVKKEIQKFEKLVDERWSIRKDEEAHKREVLTSVSRSISSRVIFTERWLNVDLRFFRGDSPSVLDSVDSANRKTKEDFEDYVIKLFEDHSKISEEIKEATTAIAKAKQQLARKKITPSEIESSKRLLSSNLLLRDKIRVTELAPDVPYGLFAQHIRIILVKTDLSYNSYTTIEDITEAVNKIIDKVYSGIKRRYINAMEGFKDIDFRMETSKMWLLSKRGDGDFNDQAVVEFMSEDLTIREILDSVESIAK